MEHDGLGTGEGIAWEGSRRDGVANTVFTAFSFPCDMVHYMVANGKIELRVTFSLDRCSPYSMIGEEFSGDIGGSTGISMGFAEASGWLTSMATPSRRGS